MVSRRKPVLSEAAPECEITERSLLGALLLVPSSYPLTAVLRPQDFLLSSHRFIYEVMGDLARSSCPVDLTTVVQELSRREELDKVGGPDFVARLLDGVPDCPRVEHYVRVLRETATLRQLCQLGEAIPKMIRNRSNLVEVLAKVEAGLEEPRIVAEETAQAVRFSRYASQSATDGSEILNQISAFIRRFVVLTPAQTNLITLWVAHTHSFEAADATPYPAVTSAEKQCGKTRLLEVLELMVAKPWYTARVTAAVLVRKIDSAMPTLLLDETDAAFNGEPEYAEALRGIFNSGHRRGAVASLCVGKGAVIETRDFRTFCPKALAGIGRLPDTIADRSIPIRLKRKGPSDGNVERFRRRLVEPEAQELRERLAAWTNHHLNSLRDARPDLPEALTDRQQDSVEPLLAIADAAGGEWPDGARHALVQVFGETGGEDSSLGVKLLADIRQVFDLRGADRLTSQELIDGLVGIETSPWSEFKRGKPLSPNGMARLLRPFEVAPRTIRVGEVTFKGYVRDWFEDSWRRYLRSFDETRVSFPISEPTQPSQCSIHAALKHFSEPSRPSLVAVEKSEQSSVNTRVVTDVTVHASPKPQDHTWPVEGEL